jgi:precorrin-3B synthase
MSLVDTSAGACRCSGAQPHPGPNAQFTATAETGATVSESATKIADGVQAGQTKGGRAFACPGLFRIVPALDGGICRIKLPLGRLVSQQARAIADIAGRFAAGAIEATNRANVQIRGIRPGTESDVIDALRAADLGAANAGADDVRNVMVSPLAGDDPDQVVDVSGIADRVLQRLQAEPRYHALSPKFGIQIDGGEAIAMLDHPNDIWLSAVDAKTFAFGFAGCPARDDRDHTAGFVHAGDAEELIFACLDFFLSFNGTHNNAGLEFTRFRHLLVEVSTTEIFARIGLPIRRDAVTASWRRTSPAVFAHLGFRPQADANLVAIGALPPLGRIDPVTLRNLADLADDVSRSEIRFTPWQSILLPNIGTTKCEAVIHALNALGFITQADKPLASLITCAGSTGCASALADTKADAMALSRQLGTVGTGVFGIHLSGCSKSCAAPRPAQATLVGKSPGRYDIFWRDSETTNKFGTLIGADLKIEQAGQLLSRRNSKQR